ncbi:MAG: hypothetical protein IPH85_13210 [Ignavibacteria bacterium]|nr:hypothetical protein [Ignavibacteria bacterium]
MKRLPTIRDLRSEILELLQTSKSPVQLIDISKRLRVRADSEDYDHLRDLLTVMSEEGSHATQQTPYSLPMQNSEGLRGVLTTYHDNATVKTDDPEMPIVHIRRQHMLTALDGDTVLVRRMRSPRTARFAAKWLPLLNGHFIRSAVPSNMMGRSTTSFPTKPSTM